MTKSKICPLHICLPLTLTTALRGKRLPCSRLSYKQNYNHTFPFIFSGRRVRIFVFSIPYSVAFRKISVRTYTAKAVFPPLTFAKLFPFCRRFLRIRSASSRTTPQIPSFTLSFMQKRENPPLNIRALKMRSIAIFKQTLLTKA